MKPILDFVIEDEQDDIENFEGMHNKTATRKSNKSSKIQPRVAQLDDEKDFEDEKEPLYTNENKHLEDLLISQMDNATLPHKIGHDDVVNQKKGNNILELNKYRPFGLKNVKQPENEGLLFLFKLDTIDDLSFHCTCEEGKIAENQGYYEAAQMQIYSYRSKVGMFLEPGKQPKESYNQKVIALLPICCKKENDRKQYMKLNYTKASMAMTPQEPLDFSDHRILKSIFRANLQFII